MSAGTMTDGAMTDGAMTGRTVREPLLRVEGLTRHYVSKGLFGKVTHTVRAVDGISFDLQPGETLGAHGDLRLHEACAEADREALLERLDMLKKSATERLDARFQAGVQAWITVPGSTPGGAGCSAMAWCRCGSNLSPGLGAIFLRPLRSKAACSSFSVISTPMMKFFTAGSVESLGLWAVARARLSATPSR